MPEASINCGTAAYEGDTQQFERAVDCLVNKIEEIAWAVQLVCLKPSWVQEFRARGSCQFFRFDIILSRVMRKPTFCICENKDADQLRGNREADQRLCFRYIDSTIPLLSKSEISSL